MGLWEERSVEAFANREPCASSLFSGPASWQSHGRHASFSGERAGACDAGGRAVDTWAWVSEWAAYLTSLGTSRPLGG